MKFAHFADCHLGSWREPKLQHLNMSAFKYAVEECIKENVDFIIIAGDLFDNALPSIDVLKEAVGEFKKLKDRDIACYIIPGSHDYSMSGKNFIDVLEKAGLCKNVINSEFHDDKIFVAGVPGKKAGLEKNLFADLQISPKGHENKFKIFLFHTTLTEAKPKELKFVESVDAKDLPEGFDYYGAGHLHLVSEFKIGNKRIIYPGPLFPNNKSELEDLKQGSFYIIEAKERINTINAIKKEIKLKEVLSISIDLEGKDAKNAVSIIASELSRHDIKDKIVILNLKGCLASGKTSDIDFKQLAPALQDAFVFLKSTSDLTTPEFKLEINTKEGDIESIEQQIISEYARKNNNIEFSSKIIRLISALSIEKHEGETNQTFENRLMDEISKVIELK